MITTSRPRTALATSALVLALAIGAQTTSAVAAGTSASCLPGVLKSRLAQIRAKFGPVTIISTHRPGASIAGTRKPSYHRWCRAVDFKPPPGKYAAVVRLLKASHSGGIGTYSCKMHHIHIDNGPRVHFHKCAK